MADILYPYCMDLFALTRKLIDIESITGNEAAVGEALARELTALGYAVERMPVEGDRFNVWATHPGQPRPELVFSTHMDTVPPFIPSSRDAPIASTDAARATPRASSWRRSRLPRN